ncbi:sugar phosphate isomerase/epimerase family protein [Candidatus Pelagibacter sp. HIMB1517]|uniref:sugar phosphate isomerase/epimerase family protein n=1 Tax=Candidatus Pelagibacter sp. HIMB1517 TaxID=3413341 RepID=UPI003F87E2B9
MNFKIGFMQGRLVPSEKSGVLQSFPWNNWTKEFFFARKLGLNLMEWTIDYHNFYKNPLINNNQHYKIKNLEKKYNVKVASVTCDFYMQKPYTAAKTKYLKKEIKKKIYKIIYSCKQLSIKNIIIPLVDNSSIKKISDEKKTINFFLQFSEELKKTKTKILFEIDYHPNKLIKFIKKFNMHFGINYDTGNSCSLGYKIKNEKKYFKWVHNIHIKDRLFKGKTVRLGKGNCNFSSFFKTLKKLNYNKNLILQTAKTQKKKEIKEFRDNLDYIKLFY